MLKAIAVTFIIFAILFSGIIALKRSANHWKVPKGIKPQPYDTDHKENDRQKSEQQNNENDSDNNQKKETPQLIAQSKTNTDEQQADKQDKK